MEESLLGSVFPESRLGRSVMLAGVCLHFYCLEIALGPNRKIQRVSC